jgi:hypothetical protein
MCYERFTVIGGSENICPRAAGWTTLLYSNTGNSLLKKCGEAVKTNAGLWSMLGLYIHLCYSQRYFFMTGDAGTQFQELFFRRLHTGTVFRNLLSWHRFYEVRRVLLPHHSSFEKSSILCTVPEKRNKPPPPFRPNFGSLYAFRNLSLYNTSTGYSTQI